MTYRTIVVPPRLTVEERQLFDGALDVAVELAKSKHEQHKGLGQIIGGLCAIIMKRDPDLLCDGESARENDK